MQAYYEMNIEIPQNHLVSFYLPETIPAGQVKIAVIYEALKTTKTAEFIAECRRQSLLLKNDTHGQNRQQWLEAVADNEGWL